MIHFFSTFLFIIPIASGLSYASSSQPSFEENHLQYVWSKDTIKDLINKANMGDFLAQDLIMKNACLLNLGTISPKMLKLITIDSWQQLETKVKNDNTWLQGMYEIYKIKGQSLPKWLVNWLASQTLLNEKVIPFTNSLASTYYAAYLYFSDYKKNEAIINQILDIAINKYQEGSSFYLKALIFIERKPFNSEFIKDILAYMNQSHLKGYISATKWLAHFYYESKQFHLALLMNKIAIDQGGYWGYNLHGVIYGKENVNLQESTFYYKNGYEKGDIYAKWNYGYNLLYEIGTPKNEELGIQLLKECAEDGIIESMNDLAQYYYAEKNNLVASIHWYAKASMHGDKDSLKSITKLIKEMENEFQ